MKVSKTSAETKIIRRAVKQRSVRYHGTEEVIDFEGVYEDLLDQGMSPEEAGVALDKYMEDNGFM